MSVDDCKKFISELRQVAAKSFQIDEHHLPKYQCLSLDDPVKSLADKVIVCVRIQDTGNMIAFTSAVLVSKRSSTQKFNVLIFQVTYPVSPRPRASSRIDVHRSFGVISWSHQDARRRGRETLSCSAS